MMEPGPGRLVDAARSGPSEARRADEHALSTLLTQDSSQSTPPSRSHESDEIACMHGSVHTTPTSGITRGRWVEYCHPPLAPAIGLVSGELPGRQTRKQVRYPSRDQGTKAHIEGMHQGSRCNDIQNCQILGPQKKLGSRVNCPSVTPATRWATANIAAVAINFECGA